MLGVAGSTTEGGADARGLERLLLDHAVRLIDVSSDQLGAALDATLAAVGAATDVDRVTVLRYDWDAETVSATHEWCADGIEPVIDQLQAVPYRTSWPEHAQQHRAGRQTYLPDVAAMPDGPLRELLLAGGTSSLLDTPLMDGGRCLGMVSLETVGRTSRWSARHQQVLTVLAQLLLNLERRRRLDETTRQLVEVSAINAELEAFAGTVAHELQTPLASALGLITLLRSGRAPAERHQELLERSEAGLTRMSQLIAELLRYAGAGRALGSLGPVALDAVVDEAVEACQRLIADRGAVLDRRALPTVQGDQLRLVEAVTNLIANAIRHTPSSETPRITISGLEHDHAVELLIADNGPGIATQDRARVLTPFTSLPGPDADPGTGLGLAIVTGIVAAHGGQLTLEDSPQGGLLVRISLPRPGAV